MIAAAPGTSDTPRAHITKMAALGKFYMDAEFCFPRADQRKSVFGTLGWKRKSSASGLRTGVWSTRDGVAPWREKSMRESTPGAMTRSERYLLAACPCYAARG